MKIDDPKLLLRHSLLPTLILFGLGGGLLIFAICSELATLFIWLGCGLLGGIILSRRFRLPKL